MFGPFFFVRRLCVWASLAFPQKLRDYNDELSEALGVKDPSFNVEELAIWRENSVRATPEVHSNAVAEAEKKLESLSADAKEKAYQHDSLAFARDVARIGELYQAMEKSERAARLQRITHIRSENCIGGQIVNAWMEGHAQHRTGSESDISLMVEQARCFQKKQSTTNQQLNTVLKVKFQIKKVLKIK